MSSPHTVNIPTWVYVHINADGDALYIGTAADVRARQYHHKGKPWWPEVVDTAVIGPFPRRQALDIEYEFIGACQPPHNIVGTHRNPSNREHRQGRHGCESVEYLEGRIRRVEWELAKLRDRLAAAEARASRQAVAS